MRACRDEKLKHLRDQRCSASRQALRTMRANVDDLQPVARDWALLVRGKIDDRLVFLRPDVAEVLRGYLATRGRVLADASGERLLAAVSNLADGHRLSRQ